MTAPILKQHVQLRRSQGADGPDTEHENLVTREYEAARARVRPANPDLLTPWLWFANGWVACLEYLRAQGEDV